MVRISSSFLYVAEEHAVMLDVPQCMPLPGQGHLGVSAFADCE